MTKLYLFAISLLLTFTTLGQSAIEADMVVALDGSGDFTKIQDAIDVVESNSTRQTIIYIKRGVYDTEKLIVPADKKNITLVGESRDETIISYHIYDCADGKCPTEDAALWTGDNIRTSATLTIHGDGFKAENLTIRNTAGPVGQAQAITVRSDKVVFVNCNLEGYQDTIYLWNDGERIYFKNCLVVGRTDYIYGGGIAFFDNCEIRSWGGGWITAPSTAESKQYGFVFYECDITYAENSPRAGDDGSKIRLGRPWHNYPKVAWLYCNMTDMIHPEGWGDTWNMDYAATSDKLHLYEYKNTGPGADMSGRANWAGLRELTDAEALNYTAEKVLAGNDNWNPAAEVPMSQSYNFTGGNDNNSWNETTNWDPQAVPAQGETANVAASDTVVANGGTFAADLNLRENAVLKVAANSTANYIAVFGTTIFADSDATLSGKIATKDIITFEIEGTFTLDASISGVHRLVKNGSGKLILASDNSGFSGEVIIEEGEIEATAENSLGKGNVTVNAGAILSVSNDLAFQPTSKLYVVSDAALNLSSTVTTSEFFIDNTLQGVGNYTAATNPEIISGDGMVLVGRPSEFQFIGGENGNWDNPAHFVPSLMPEAGETVYCGLEMETTSTVFEADIVVTGNGRIRLRGGDHVCTGTITMQDGTSFSYNTGGSGFTLTASVVLEGDILLVMESGNASGSQMVMPGTFTGNHVVTALNNGKGTVNIGKVVLQGNNSGFFGVWDATAISSKYPSDPYVSMFDGQVENAFGNGFIDIDNGNKVIFSHAKAATGSLAMSIKNNGKAELNAEVKLDELTINDQQLADGRYDASSNPEWFEGEGAFIVGEYVGVESFENDVVLINEDMINFKGNNISFEIYNISGVKVNEGINPFVNMKNFGSGIFIVSYTVDGFCGVTKHIVK
ncbi:MAG: pectinesterase family protein [Prolixibacteraceae bacterium]|jgi:autotransporter-associated beta strand protein|nr:pectinesterase family protein [Prolixibacteraceae bacterium]